MVAALVFLKKTIVILSVLIGFKLVQLVFAIQSGKTSSIIPLFATLILICVITILVIKGNKYALLAIGIYLLAQVGAIAWGILIPIQHYFLKATGILLGTYFVFGGVIMLQQALRASRKHSRS